MTNIVPTVSLNSLATAFLSSGTYIGVGDSASTPTLLSTILGNQLDRNAVTLATASGATATFEAFFTTSEPNPTTSTTIREVGLFNAATAGTLALHAQPIIPVIKTINKTMLVTITVTFSNA